MEHESFYIDHAVAYGLDAAVVLHRVYRWIKFNKSTRRNMVKGVYWTRLSSKQASEYLPFMSEQKIARLMRELVAAGAMIAEDLNRRSTDRTKWYTIPDGVIPGFSARSSSGERESLDAWGDDEDVPGIVQPTGGHCSRMSDQDSKMNALLDKEKQKKETKEEREEQPNGCPLSATPSPKTRQKKTKSSICPQSFTLDPELRQWCAATAPGVNVDRELQKFMAHEFKTPKSNWNLAFKNWMLRAVEYQGKSPTPTGARPLRSPMSSADAQRMIDTGDLNGFELA